MPFFPGTNNDDLLVGTAFDDVIAGFDGNDFIDDGGSGADELVGGRGNDSYFVRDSRASVVEYADEGYDIVNTSLAAYFLNANVERLIYVGPGSFSGIGNGLDNAIDSGAGNDILAGGAGSDLLRSGSGDDLLDGGTGLDTMIGGSGNDRYYVDSRGDSIIENAGEGIDWVIAASAVASYTLPANVEYLSFVGVQTFYGYGNALDNVMFGGSADDHFFGDAGADVLYGRDGDDWLYGGTGAANTLVGGAGNDTYITEATGDTIFENANEGTDRIFTAASSYILPSNVENLFYQGTGSFSGTGNSLSNIIVGGPSRDYFTGGGGQDEFYGGLGDDIYYLTGSEHIVEFSGQGTDTIVALDYAAFVMSGNVENFISRAYFSVAVTGNGLDNLIIGTKEQTYYYPPSGGEFPNAGNSLFGGGGNDTIVGGDAADFITGGDGSDLLRGGMRSDQFRYLGGETGLDRIYDFEPGTDKIALSNSGFSHTATVAFVSGGAPVADSSNSTFLYDTNTGVISFDRDGTGAAAAVQLAQLNPGLTLSVNDFGFF